MTERGDGWSRRRFDLRINERKRGVKETRDAGRPTWRKILDIFARTAKFCPKTNQEKRSRDAEGKNVARDSAAEEKGRKNLKTLKKGEIKRSTARSGERRRASSRRSNSGDVRDGQVRGTFDGGLFVDRTRRFFQVGEEVRVSFRDAARVFDCDAVDSQACERETHRHSVIVVSRDSCAV